MTTDSHLFWTWGKLSTLMAGGSGASACETLPPGCVSGCVPSSALGTNFMGTNQCQARFSALRTVGQVPTFLEVTF